MRYLIGLFLLSISVFLVSEVSAQNSSDRGEYFIVELQVARDDAVVATPIITLQPGKPSVISVPRVDGYAIKIQASPRRSERPDGVELKLDVYFAGNDGWTQVAAPMLTVDLGATSTYSVARDGSGKSLEVQARVTRGMAAFSEMKAECPLAKDSIWKALMEAPVSQYGLVAVQFTPPGIGGKECCSGVCVSCCSTGPICCSDEHNCPGGGCCTS